jgi:eukaryotic-like serine/threonine-protein kinase
VHRGRTPFDGPDGYSIGYKHVHELPKPLAEAAPGTPEGLAAVTMKLLEKAPEARYQRGHDVADALYAWMATEEMRDEPPVRAARAAG